MKKWNLNLLKRIQDLTIWRYRKMKVLMKLSQFILEMNERQKYTKRQWANILKTLKLMNIEQNLIQQNGGQSMRL